MVNISSWELSVYYMTANWPGNDKYKQAYLKSRVKKFDQYPGPYRWILICHWYVSNNYWAKLHYEMKVSRSKVNIKPYLKYGGVKFINNVRKISISAILRKRATKNICNCILLDGKVIFWIGHSLKLCCTHNLFSYCRMIFSFIHVLTPFDVDLQYRK